MGGGNVVGAGPKKPSAGLSPRGRGKRAARCSASVCGRSIPAWAGETRLSRKMLRKRRVYPRVGGGNTPSLLSRRIRYGLSPRGRGKRFKRHVASSFTRSIPAWAGETAAYLGKRISVEVYPRVGGGNPARLSLRMRTEGLSPRGRGKLPGRAYVYGANGSIPAWAGETSAGAHHARAYGVYPRVGGGNRAAACLS